jgi:RHH-type proline utilization regulon transcriptional repressor/proline dehydrogenase/delta 1-pyrroline-5-carboxylate dehydrogenase
VILRLDHDDAATLQLARLAAETCGVPLHVSLASEETDAQFVTRLATLAQHAEFLRTVTRPSSVVLAAAYDAGLHWIDAPILANGRFELPRWLREQAVSETRHRYGHLIEPAPSDESARKDAPASIEPGPVRKMRGRRSDGRTNKATVAPKPPRNPVRQDA